MSVKLNLIYILIFILIVNCKLPCQIYTVEGHVFAENEPVTNALISFTDNSDTSKVYFCNSDTLGYYKIDILTSIGKTEVLPTSIELDQNYPNPFTNQTTISFKMNKPEIVDLIIYNLLGQEVRKFEIGAHATGKYKLTWDGKNNYGTVVAKGIYFYQLKTRDRSIVKKMIYGLNSKYYNILNESISKENTGNYERLEDNSNESSFTVKIQNTQLTSPKISITEFTEVFIEQNIILNYEVLKSIMDFSLCYQKVDTTFYDGVNQPNWEIFLNNQAGSYPKNISNWVGDDEYPEWSPDGKYIAFQSGRQIYLYDTSNDTLNAIVAFDTVNSTRPRWTQDSKKVIYGYHTIGQPAETHIIDISGSNDQKLHTIPAFFYNDNYTFVYVQNYDSVYLSNLDNTYNEFLLDLKTIGRNYVGIRDFNPLTNELLILADPTPQINNLLVSFNTNTRVVDTISIADTGWIYLRPKFSHNFEKIAVGEVNYVDNIYRFSILENNKKEIFTLPDGATFHWSDFAFSYDNKFLSISLRGTNYSSLYILELANGLFSFIDFGIHSQWNPNEPH